ncbi:unnamed protein product [Brugia pahangi]|uniref:Protein kinase domain-containing protein n=1 Tax=Brugia pahangi TaxID=6280 RepID=A0A0N4TVS0_BRUPA|nr:unnamed protein product [Brugia pahangi]
MANGKNHHQEEEEERLGLMHCHKPIYITADNSNLFHHYHIKSNFHNTVLVDTLSVQEYLKITQKTDKCSNKIEGTDKWVNLALEMKDAILATTILHGEVNLRNDLL